MTHGLSTLVAICLTGVAVTAVQAQPQVVVKDKLPAGAADTPSTAPSPEVLTRSREAVEKAANEAQARQWDAAAAAEKEEKMAKNLADADVILRVPIRITGFDRSRMPKDSRKEEYRIEPNRQEVRMACEVTYLVTYGYPKGQQPTRAVFEVTLTPRITNGALDMVQEFGFPFRRWDPDATGFRDLTYVCRLGYGVNHTFTTDALCQSNTTGAGNTCRVQGDIPADF
ncbi:MAG: hypothetical protein ACLGIT_02770 [Gammaproteobacteria bacterium]|mgnify:CR=1 FL=1